MAGASYSVYEEDGTPYAIWDDDNFANLAAGTVLEGEKAYIAEVVLVPAFGHYFDDYTASNATFNGEAATKAQYDGNNAEGMLTVFGSVTTVHNWDTGKVTTKPTLDKAGVKTFTCKCGATKTAAIAKLKANTMKVSKKTAKVSYKKVAKKAQKLKLSKVLVVKNAKGAVSFAKKSGNKKITINKKTGKVTIKKGLKKGTYKVKVNVTAAGNGEYGALTTSVTFKIKVK